MKFNLRIIATCFHAIVSYLVSFFSFFLGGGGVAFTTPN